MSQRYQPERLVYELEADLKDGFSDMDDLLKPVKTVRNVKSNIEKFETLALRESQPKIDVISTKKIISDISNGSKGSRNGWENEDGREQSANGNDIEMKDATSGGDIGINKSPVELVQSVDNQVSSPEQALVILKEQPADEVLEAVLRYLDDGIQRKHDFNIHIPSATAAQILNVLVISIIPDRWAILSSAGASKQDKEVKKLLLSCMNSTAGIGVLVARLQTLITSSQLRQPGSSQNATFKDTALFLASMLYHKTFIRGLVSQVQSSGAKPGQQQAVWVEATSLLAGSRILNVFQEASTISEVKDHIPSWLQDPKVYSRWLGGNIASAATTIPPNNEEAWKMLANFLKRALSLGQRGTLNYIRQLSTDN